MKRLLLTLVLVIGLCSPALGLNATLDCHGTSSGGDGFVDCDANPRDYAYKLTTGDASVIRVFIGTDDTCTANYTNICMPDGWTWEISTRVEGHYPDKTPHGNVSPGRDGSCDYVILFGRGSGEAIPSGGNTFNFGFDHPYKSHDVGWDVWGDYYEDWAKPVGLGEGPVHGPHKSPYEGPTLSQWGLIALLVVLTGIATWVVLKRRRVATA